MPWSMSAMDPESVNEMKEEAEGMDQEWKTKVEKRLAFMKEMSRGQKGKEDDKAKKVDVDRMVQETAGLKEPERMLKARVEAAEEELSRKRVENSETKAWAGVQRSRRV